MTTTATSGHKFGITLGLSLGVVVMTVTPALAQSNLPYRPGGGVGLSTAARQAITNNQVFGTTPRALIRSSPDGLLFGIQREGRTALLQSPEGGAFLPGARPNRSYPTGLGTGLGWSGVSFGGVGLSSGFSGSAGIGTSSISLASWINQLPSGSTGARDGSTVFLSSSTTPIDAWIQQLNLI